MIVSVKQLISPCPLKNSWNFRRWPRPLGNSLINGSTACCFKSRITTATPGVPNERYFVGQGWMCLKIRKKKQLIYESRHAADTTDSPQKIQKVERPKGITQIDLWRCAAGIWQNTKAIYNVSDANANTCTTDLWWTVPLLHLSMFLKYHSWRVKLYIILHALNEIHD